MKKPFWVMSLVAAAAFTSAHATPVVVEIVDAKGKVFQQVPAKAEARAYRAYLEAERDARYRIRIRNSTGSRVGVVVAVDGRNIISGARSELGNNEPMYIIDGWDAQEYSGWRANLSEVNEFYFTEWNDSYAEAFGDRSARGVIAVAVYPEKKPFRVFSQEPERRADAPASARDEAATSAAPAEPSVAQSERQAKKAERSNEAGTGYGDRRTEYVTQVEFTAESRASQRVFLKYEWRETLCSKGILSCDDPPNRFWPSSRYGFAPPPPGRAR